MAVNNFYPNDTNYGQETFARNAPGFVDVRVLAANIEQTHTIPADAKTVIFSSTGNFFAKINTAASVPGGTVTDGTGSELNPSIWYIKDETSISLIASSVTTITMTFNK